MTVAELKRLSGMLRPLQVDRTALDNAAITITALTQQD